MKIYRSGFWGLGLAFLLILPLTVSAQTPKVHRHADKLDSMVAEIEPDFSIVETTLEKNAPTENLVKNKTRTLEAFTVGGARIFVRDLKSGKVFELKGLPFEQRYFSDLAWADNQTLMFDRWAQPNYGNHYAVNFVKKKLLDAAPFGVKPQTKQKTGMR